MTVADFVVDVLIKNGVKDVFGIPGGVILDFLYALERRKDDISVHLNFHEQACAFAAEGYAQASGRLGVAYATRGPGITNMITAIADAHFDSIPTLFISSHHNPYVMTTGRFSEEQEFDTVGSLKSITKYAERIETVAELPEKLSAAIYEATEGRPGAVFIDILSSLWKQEMTGSVVREKAMSKAACYSEVVGEICSQLEISKRPIYLIGAGVRQSNSADKVASLIDNAKIPVLSSAVSQDLLPTSKKYFGYIGSHGLRYSNYILAESDLIIALGNRLAFNHKSDTFGFVSKKKIIHIDIEITGIDLRNIVAQLDVSSAHYTGTDWLDYCKKIKSIFDDCDTSYPVCAIADILKQNPNSVFVGDVGNNEFWLARAYAYAGVGNRLLLSKSFAALGCALPKAIGAYHALKKPVVCFTGDQGLLFNIQELHYIAEHNLPITIVLLNNASSGMIRSVQKKQRRDRFIHTTIDSGYAVPDFAEIARAFGVNLIELRISDEIEPPHLPVGNVCYDFLPALSEDKASNLLRMKGEYYGFETNRT